jgi:16S rRNA (adenine1518-N6/adenine1519-N6)-dimethyltransferase
MVQREVAERLVASAGASARGSVSVRVELRAEARLVSAVPRTVFHPRPDVESALVAARRGVHPDAAGADVAVIDRLCAVAFNQRRKMLRRSLAATLPDDAFERSGVAPTARPAELTVAEWAALARVVTEAGP